MDTTHALKVPLDSPRQLYRNYARNAALAAKARDVVLPMLRSVRRNRQMIDRKAMRRYNQWSLITDDRFYLGRANTYIPAVRRGVERLVTQLVRETFPNDDWWDLRATDREFEANVDGQRALMTVQLAREMRVKRKARPAYRQLVLYGISPVKVPWKYQERTRPRVSTDERTGRAVVEKFQQVLYDGPDFQPIDFFSFGVYPMTVLDVQDAKLVYEDLIVDLDELTRDKENYANLDRARASAGGGTSGSEAFQQRVRRLQQLGIVEDELKDKNYGFLTECYTDFDFEDRFGLGPEPAIVTLAWEHEVVRLQRDPYARGLWFVMKDAEMPGEFFAHARTEATDRLQISLNDANNQDADASMFANTPIVVCDPNIVEDYQAIALYPGAKIPAPPDAVKFDRPPDAAYSQKEKIAFYNALILENLGAPVGVSPSPAAQTQTRGARTFGGMQLLQMLAGSESKELVEFQEDAVWEPMLAWIAKLNADFLSDERTLRMAGRKGAPLLVSRDTFRGDYAYEWLGTATVQNQTLRSAQMLVFMNVLRGLQVGPGWRVNVPKILRDWWRLQGLKDADEVVLEEGRVQPIDPEVENLLVREGRRIEVSPRDPDADHIVAHARARMQYAPEDPRHEALLAHEQAHYSSFLMKQQATMLAQQPQAMPGAPMPGQANGGPAPRGMRAGEKASGTPTSGMGPMRTMMDMNVGAGP